jgi:putative flippase GtrA
MTLRLAPRAAVRLRQYGGFVLAGLLAFAADAAILEGLMRGAALSPYLARPIGISVAMVIAWSVNRTVTFAVRTPPSAVEFLHYAAVSWTAQLVNYVVFAAILVALPETPPFVALAVASAVSMLLSYSGFRYAVFGKRQRAGLARITK